MWSNFMNKICNHFICRWTESAFVHMSLNWIALSSLSSLSSLSLLSLLSFFSLHSAYYSSIYSLIHSLIYSLIYSSTYSSFYSSSYSLIYSSFYSLIYSSLYSRNGQFALQGIRKNYQKGEKHSDVYRRIANSEKDSRGRNRNWNGSDIHAWTRQIQQSDKRLRQNNHNESETASY